MPTNVFLSVGRTFTPTQESFVVAFERFLRAQGLEPQTVGRTYVKNQQPLRSIEECMVQCSGAVVLAFERVYVAEGEEKRGSDEALPLREARLPTVWNQIEASIAYARNLPLLVIVEHGLRSEGLLEKGYDWYVKWIRLDPSVLADQELIGLVKDWKTQVEVHKQQSLQTAKRPARAFNSSEMTIGELLSSLKPAQLWTVVSAVVAAVAAIAAFAYKLGGLSPPAP